jgi:p38 MAP kinase
MNVPVYSHDYLLDYNQHEKIGSGTYGNVYVIENKMSGKKYALKIFEDTPLLVHRCTVAELDILIRLRNSYGIINPIAIYMLGTVSVVLPLGTDLESWSSSNRLDRKIFKKILHDILLGLHTMHSASIIHRDVKPSNIVILESGDFNLIDLGMCKVFGGTLGHQVQTQSYRCPEIYMHKEKYDSKIDIWSLGCIAMELVIGRNYFGLEIPEIINNISSLMRTPYEVKHRELSECENFIRFTISADSIKRNSVSNILKNADTKFAIKRSDVNIIRSMLSINPSSRPNTYELLTSRYFSSKHQMIQNYKFTLTEWLHNNDTHIASCSTHDNYIIHQYYDDIIRIWMGHNKKTNQNWQQLYISLQLFCNIISNKYEGSWKCIDNICHTISGHMYSDVLCSCINRSAHGNILLACKFYISSPTLYDYIKLFSDDTESLRIGILYYIYSMDSCLKKNIALNIVNRRKKVISRIRNNYNKYYGNRLPSISKIHNSINF